MQITVNGKIETLLQEMTLQDYIKQKGLVSRNILIEYNFQLVSSKELLTIYLKENDRLEVLQIVGGG